MILKISIGPITHRHFMEFLSGILLAEKGYGYLLAKIRLTSLLFYYSHIIYLASNVAV